MNTKCYSAVRVVLFGLISGFSLAAAEKTAPASRPSPTLKLDASPVNDGKSSLVTSYAEVIEPAQTAVVSVYSKKIVRQRVAINPLLRQFFGD